ncbi:hypothetical protein J2X01_003014 [Arthrobacter ginsengisoli]|uniref:DUF4386 domain-containing protein n=1 Tax=Arthrobacter ginsengisoli TaxID=1356565 RepID=A0ABU1UEU3_9MICC|nr:DUF4386 domain-containing protein [Arthrobacter ginsengisoli]MDR7083719.1 hypothetical protein [Arthrobacter ginsengisoli]
MTGTGRTAATKRVPMNSLRKTALIAGAFYLITIFVSIPALVLKGPVLSNPGYILGPGPDTAVIWAGLLDVIAALACIGTAVVLFPVVKRQNEAAALGFAAARVLEAAIIVVGVVSLLSIVTLRQDLAGAGGAEAASLATTGRSLVAFHNWTFLLGPGIIPALNALLLGYLMYRSGLVPRVIPLVGLIGAPLLLASAAATLFGINDQISVWSAIAGIPMLIWEFSLGSWLVVKGFKPSPITAGEVAAGTPAAYRDVDA